MTELNPYNINAFLWLNHNLAGTSEWFWQCVTLLGDGYAALTLIAIVAAFLSWFAARALLMRGILTGIVTGLASAGLKQAFDAPRPLSALSQDLVHVMGQPLYNHSFPSGHSITGFALAFLLFSATRSRIFKCIVLILAILIAMSRVVVGAHWPQDVLAGSLIGWSLSWLTLIALNRIYPFRDSSQVEPSTTTTTTNPLLDGLILLIYGLFIYGLFQLNSGYPLANPLQTGLTALGMLALVKTTWLRINLYHSRRFCG